MQNSKKKILFKDAIKESANLEKNIDKFPNWREDNPKKKSYIGSKPTRYKEFDKLFKLLETLAKTLNVKDIDLSDNILKITFSDDSTKDIDLSDYLDNKNLKSLDLDKDNKKITATLTDDTTIDLDVTDLFDNKNLKSLDLDKDNKKITATLTDDTTIDLDVTDIYDKIDDKVSKIDSTDNAIAKFDGTDGNIQDSNVIINDNNELTVNADYATININGDTDGTLNVIGENGKTLIHNTNDGLSAIFARTLDNDNSDMLFYTGTTERVRITKDGNIGIGTSNPDGTLQIEQDYARFHIKAGNGKPAIGFYKSNEEAFATIQGINTDDGAGDLAFLTDDGSKHSEKVRITKDGYVGIGVDNPTAPIELESKSDATAIRIRGRSSDNISEINLFSNDNETLQARLQSRETYFAINAYNDADIYLNAYDDTKITVSETSIEHSDFTKLGSDSPAIKYKKLTGTTGDEEGKDVSIDASVDTSKILSIDILVEYTSDKFVKQGNVDTLLGDGYQFDYYIDNPNIHIKNASDNSSKILSKPIRILITYEE